MSGLNDYLAELSKRSRESQMQVVANAPSNVQFECPIEASIQCSVQSSSFFKERAEIKLIRGFPKTFESRVLLCIDMCVDMCLDRCIDRCIGRCADMCIDKCIDMCIDMCTGMFI